MKAPARPAPARISAAGLLLALAAACAVAPLQAQLPGGGVPPGARSRVSGTDDAGLRAAARQVASGWSRDGLDGIGSLLVTRGIRFDAGAGARETLEPRKAMAALQDLFERRHTVTARVSKVSPAEGSQDRGSAEIEWDAVAPGTSQVVRSTVFVGFVRQGGRWWIDEIRILQ